MCGGGAIPNLRDSIHFESAASEAESTIMELPEVLRVWDGRRRSPYGTDTLGP